MPLFRLRLHDKDVVKNGKVSRCVFKKFHIHNNVFKTIRVYTHPRKLPKTLYYVCQASSWCCHSSYDQRDPCGEGEQLQVPRCKHLRGPDLDCTHSNTGQESQAKTVPSATAEEIQGLTSNPENFLFRGHRKCIDSVHLSVVQ